MELILKCMQLVLCATPEPGATSIQQIKKQEATKLNEAPLP